MKDEQIETTKTELNHEERLIRLIKQKIEAKGPISFAHFMRLALYTPHFGYYTSDRQKFGKAGDFTTGPEISALYSCCIAKQCEQVTTATEGDILEFGAGSGIMAVRILQKLAAIDALPRHYYIMEVSRHLQAEQKQTLQQHVPHLLSRVQWLTSLNDLQFRGIILANEVLDAFPAHRFKFEAGRLKEAFVTIEQDEFRISWNEPLPAVKKYLAEINLSYREDYEGECNLFLRGWLKAVSEILIQGACLLIDYGFPRHEYYHPERNRGTLMCHYRHRAHDDPFVHIGRQDMTTHVDFTAVAEAAEATGLSLSGFTNQANFLLSCGIIDELQKESAQDYTELTNQIKILTSPNEMGELFKVMALTKELAFPLLGFSVRNICEKL